MKQAIINKLREFFTLQPVEKAWVFGSYSRGEESRESDIDILVRFDKNANVTLFKYIGIVNALQSLLHKKIDLVEEGQLKDFAKESAEQDKILIYERQLITCSKLLKVSVLTGTREIRHSVCRYQKFTDNWRSGIFTDK